jgi:hypothetical protein
VQTQYIVWCPAHNLYVAEATPINDSLTLVSDQKRSERYSETDAYATLGYVNHKTGMLFIVQSE